MTEVDTGMSRQRETPPAPDPVLAGLELATDAPFETWVSHGERLLAIERRVLWLIGEWWLSGERRWGETAAQAVDPRDARTCQTAAWVVSKFPRENRRPELSFSHHRELAGLPEPVRGELLNVAVDEGLSCAQLRSRVWAAKRKTPDAPPGPPDAVVGQPEPESSREAETGSYGLVMPFVVTVSHGGPYEDESFCAGWECAQLDAALAAAPAAHDVTLRSASVPQADLIAMRHGFALVAEEWPDDGSWTLCRFTRAQ